MLPRSSYQRHDSHRHDRGKHAWLEDENEVINTGWRSGLADELDLKTLHQFSIKAGVLIRGYDTATFTRLIGQRGQAERIPAISTPTNDVGGELRAMV